MANIVNSRVINDGPRNHIVQISITADGGSGDEISFPVVDPTLTDPVCDRFAVNRVQVLTSGRFGVKLAFGGTTEVPFMETVPPITLNPSDDAEVKTPTTTDFDKQYGISDGIPDPRVANYAGTIVLTTDGMDTAGETAQIFLELTKKY